MLKKRKRDLKELLKPPELPLELWELIVMQLDDPQDWLNLTLANPVVGEYSLTESCQKKIRAKYVKKYIEEGKPVQYGEHLDFGEMISYKLSNGKLQNPAVGSPALTHIYPLAKIMKKTWYERGRKHRDKEPACILYEGDHKRREEWYKNGKKHREGGPAAILYYKNSKQKQSETWYKNGKNHREDAPAYIYYRKTGEIRREEWWQDGKRRQDGLPFKILYFKRGKIQREEWWKNQGLHRDFDPAYILYHCRGTKKVEMWYKNGRHHRDNGLPAVVMYENDGSTKTCEEWWVNGENTLNKVIKF